MIWAAGLFRGTKARRQTTHSYLNTVINYYLVGKGGSDR